MQNNYGKQNTPNIENGLWKPYKHPQFPIYSEVCTGNTLTTNPSPLLRENQIKIAKFYLKIPSRIILVIVATIATLQSSTTYGYPLLPVIDDISQELEVADVHGIPGEPKELTIHFSSQTHMPYPYYQYILAQSQLLQDEKQKPLEQDEIPEPQHPKIEDPTKFVVQGSILDEYDYEDEEFLEDLEMVESNWKIRHNENHAGETGDKV
ncbi:unnamed protein product [Orchesella dallaii]|uniref:Transmembrane protein n=1 Tax=Orchesella dallaii TaxID=48710 RepID=A0ABP1PP20_9HEXA